MTMPDYRGAAVIAAGADYRGDAARILAGRVGRARARGDRRGTPPTASRSASCCGTYDRISAPLCLLTAPRSFLL